MPGGSWLFPLLLFAIAAIILLNRPAMARAQSNILGGRVSPGCVVVEAALVVAIALLFLILEQRGVFRP